MPLWHQINMPAPLPDLSTLDAAAMRTLILEQHAQLVSRDNEIENLKLLVLKLRRMQFGRKSEKLDTQIAQLELQLEDLEASETESAAVRPKLACTGCDTIVQAPASNGPIERGLAGPGLLAHVLVAKYSAHLPLYRPAEIYERAGVELDRATLAGWVGAPSQLLAPLVDTLRRYVMATGKVHGDDTPVPVLEHFRI